MQIFIIARGYPTKQNPQWGCFEKDQALALNKMGHKVVILSYRQHPFIPNLGYQVIEEQGICSISFNALPGRLLGKQGTKLRIWFEQWELDKAYKCAVKLYGEPDIIYSHYLFITHVATHLKRKYNKPLIGIEHWSELNKENIATHIERMAKKTYSTLDALITVSHSLEQSIQNHFKCNSIVIHNMIGDEFQYMPQKTKQILQFISTGSLIKRKGFDLLLLAFKKLKLPSDKWNLNIIGEGKEHRNLQKQIREHGLNNNIHLLGGKNKTEIAELLNQSDVFILPSRNENFSVAVLEALACGLPVIASICGGIKECINDKNGLLFEVDDINGLAKCIKYMYDHHQDYDRQAIAADCKAHFSSEVIAKQLTNIFEDVMAEHKNKK